MRDVRKYDGDGLRREGSVLRLLCRPSVAPYRSQSERHRYVRENPGRRCVRLDRLGRPDGSHRRAPARDGEGCPPAACSYLGPEDRLFDGRPCIFPVSRMRVRDPDLEKCQKREEDDSARHDPLAPYRLRDGDSRRARHAQLHGLGQACLECVAAHLLRRPSPRKCRAHLDGACLRLCRHQHGQFRDQLASLYLRGHGEDRPPARNFHAPQQEGRAACRHSPHRRLDGPHQRDGAFEYVAALEPHIDRVLLLDDGLCVVERKCTHFPGETAEGAADLPRAARPPLIGIAGNVFMMGNISSDPSARSMIYRVVLLTFIVLAIYAAVWTKRVMHLPLCKPIRIEHVMAMENEMYGRVRRRRNAKRKEAVATAQAE